MFKITKRKEIAKNIILNEIYAPLISEKANPGQFVIIRANETGERVPLTIADNDPIKGTITIVYMVVGKSTLLFKSLKEGEEYKDVIGPLGKPTHIEKIGHVVCVGGGTGVAVLHPIARGLKEIGNKVDCIIGSRSKDLLIFEKQMSAASNNLTICTDDGSYGHHGFVTNILEEKLVKKNIKLVVAIGPVPMMKACVAITKKFKVKTLVSLNPIMIDGTGMCGGCRVTINGETQFACVDGPEFDGHLVDFDELTLRLLAYSKSEKISNNNFCQVK